MALIHCEQIRSSVTSLLLTHNTKIENQQKQDNIKKQRARTRDAGSTQDSSKHAWTPHCDVFMEQVLPRAHLLQVSLLELRMAVTSWREQHSKAQSDLVSELFEAMVSSFKRLGNQLGLFLQVSTKVQ